MSGLVDGKESVAIGSRAGAAGSSAWRRAAGAAGFALLTALAARVAVPLPGTPVPFTLQVVAVLLSGFLLGPRLGAASQALYLALGMGGLPVFAAGGGAAYLLGPTGGYLLAFPAASAIAGWFAWRRGGAALPAIGLVLALAAIHAGGLAWLTVLMNPRSALATGVLPFLPGDLLKLLLVLLIGSRFRDRALRLLG
ncbi:MAG: biotin transporter BioY [Gemmatimonadota bacterium]